MRRLSLGNVIEGALHRRALTGHALGLPLAIHADVQGDGIVKHRPPHGVRRDWQHHRCRRGPQYPSHRSPKRYSGDCVPQSMFVHVAAIKRRRSHWAPPLLLRITTETLSRARSRRC